MKARAFFSFPPSTQSPYTNTLETYFSPRRSRRFVIPSKSHGVMKQINFYQWNYRKLWLWEYSGKSLSHEFSIFWKLFIFYIFIYRKLCKNMKINQFVDLFSQKDPTGKGVTRVIIRANPAKTIFGSKKMVFFFSNSKISLICNFLK